MAPIVNWELMYNDELTAPKWALNSAVECHLHTVEVIGSNPIAPTILIFQLHRSVSTHRSAVVALSAVGAETSLEAGWPLRTTISTMALDPKAPRTQLSPSSSGTSTPSPNPQETQLSGPPGV